MLMTLSEFALAGLWWLAIIVAVTLAVLVGKTILDWIGERVYGRVNERRCRR